MIYDQVLRKAGDRQVRFAVIGAGEFGTSLLTQCRHMPRLTAVAVCDRDLEAARRACTSAGFADEDLRVCDTASAARAAAERGRCVVTTDPEIAVGLSLDVVVEATGVPEAGAKHADLALRAGKHVAMVSKEADCIVGPLLAARARSAGLIYTPVDGDQHGLLVGMVLWARLLGFDVVAGGKARESDFVFDPSTGVVCDRERQVTVPMADRKLLEPLRPGAVAETIAARRALFQGLRFATPADFAEMAIASNHLGLVPDIPALHTPAVRTIEAAEVLSLEAEGGLLRTSGAIEIYVCLRRVDEPGPMGGEFIVVRCEDEFNRKFLRHKGLIMNRAGTLGLVYRPLHMLGVEAPISILCAAAGITTGSSEVKARTDVVARARVRLAAGRVLDHETLYDSRLIEPLLVPCTPVGSDNALPLYMGLDRRLRKDLPAGAILTAGMVDEPAGSSLWDLRRAQDRELAP